MFRFHSGSFPHLKSTYVRNSQTQSLLAWLQLNPLSTTCVQTSKLNPKEEKKLSFTAKYLVEKLGFSPRRAISCSKFYSFETAEQPDSVILALKNLKLTETQISKVLKMAPSILAHDPEETILPKIRYFRSLGLAEDDISGILCDAPYILRRDLEERLIPIIDYLKGVIKSDEKIIDCLKRFPSILRIDPQSSLIPNISLLRELGVPQAHMELLLSNQPRLFVTSHGKLKGTVEKVQGLGIEPSGVKFMLAVHVLRAMSGSTWENKVQIYKNWGLSEDEILEAFAKQPWFMSASEGKIMDVMDFLVNQMGFQGSVLLQRPGIIAMSLQKRIRPRCVIYKALCAKGLVKKPSSLGSMLTIQEEKFLQRFVECYKEEAPELLDIYKENMALTK